tara:strand:+ start:3403 stop:3726 length:324 start_codon:yes stop_codon:yes gene_type:complete
MPSDSHHASNSPTQQTDNEEIDYTIDFSAALGTGITVASGVQKVYDLTEREKDFTSTASSGSVSISSPNCTCEVKLLERGHNYRLEVLATFSDGDKVLSYIIIECVL